MRPGDMFRLVASGLGALVCAFGIGTLCGQARMRYEAIELGHAEWVVVGPSGKTEFRWKEGER